MSIFEFNYFPKGTGTDVPAPAPAGRKAVLDFDYKPYISNVEIAKPLPTGKSNVASLLVDFTANKKYDRTTIYYYVEGVKQLNTMRNRLIDVLTLTLTKNEQRADWLTWMEVFPAEDKKAILDILAVHKKRSISDVELKAVAPPAGPVRPASYYTNIYGYPMPAPSATAVTAKTSFAYDYTQTKRNMDIALPTAEPTRTVPEIMNFAYDAKPPDTDNVGFRQYLNLYHLLIAELHVLQDHFMKIVRVKQKALECITLGGAF